MNDRRKWLSRATLAVLVLYWLAEFAGTHAPVSPELGFESADKVLHFSAYGGLAFLIAAVWSFRKRLKLVHYLQILTLAGLYGAFDEISQIPVGRDCELNDWIADVIGAALGLVVFRVILALGGQRLESFVGVAPPSAPVHVAETQIELPVPQPGPADPGSAALPRKPRLRPS